MGKSEKVLDYDNVNGVHLSLKMERLKNSTNSMSFTISFKNKEQKSQWPKISLAFAIIFNILALVYIRISVTAILIIFIVLSFLVFFWITHSVQSESVVVIPTVGIQNSIKYVFGREDIFVAWANIDDVIIHEVIKLNRVLYFLTLLVKNSASQSSQESDGIKLIPLFKEKYCRDDIFCIHPSPADAQLNTLNRGARYYELSCVRKGKMECKVELEYTKPRLVMLEAIYTELQSLLMTARRRDDELASGDIE